MKSKLLSYRNTLMLDKYLNHKYSYEDLKNLKKEYINNKPFPHISLNNFFKHDVISEVANNFPDLREQNSYKKNNINEKKFILKNIDLYPKNIKDLVIFLNSQTFLNFLNKITDIKEPLLADEKLYGGGLHQSYSGGYLKVHSDYYKHPASKLDRRINLLIYLSKDWKESYGGGLELWNKDMSRCEKKIFPILNNICIFSTNSKSYHGFPDPITCPESYSRNSIAMYYYTDGRSDDDDIYLTKNTSNWKKRSPDDIVSNDYSIKDYLRRIPYLKKIKDFLKK